MSRKMMLQVVLAGAAAVLVVLTGATRAALLAYEGFDYDATPPATLQGNGGGLGWGGTWEYSGAGAEGEFTVLADSLSSPVYPAAAAGGSARAAGPGTGGSNTVRLDRPLADPFSLAEDGVLYASFLMRKDVTNPGSNNNMELDLGANVIRFGSTSNDQWFLNVSGDAFGTVATGETYFVVVRVQASASSDDVRSVLIFDPSRPVPPGEPAVWDYSNSFASSDELDQVRFWIGRLAEGVFDEIRLGTTWASVTVPEPTSLLLLVAYGVVGQMGVHRRRAR